MSKGRTFLHRYLDLNAGTEIPDLFALWSGFSALSCVFGRRIWLDMGVYQVYPNLYTVLVAASGRMRKSTAIDVMSSLIYKLEPQPRLIAQKTTPEALIDALSRAEVEDGEVVESCEGFIVADELSTFLNRRTYEQGLAPLLISLFDCKETFEYRTKGKGSQRINNSCLGMLSASTVDWIRNAIPEDAIGGGLTSRMIFVYVDKPSLPVALTEFSQAKEFLKVELTKELQGMTVVKGKAHLNDDARDLYVHTYDTFYAQSPMYEDKALSGYASRRHVYILKLALILAASERQLTIEVRHLETAIAALERVEKNMPKVLNLILTTDKGDVVDMVYRKVLSAGPKGVSRSKVLQGLSYKGVSAWELTNIIETLVVQGKITIDHDGSAIVYKPVNAE